MIPTDNPTITVEVNGRETQETIPARTLLSEFLRENQHLTGTHRGCETSKCGACTVLMDGEAVKSCNVLAVQADGTSVTTVEGLSDGGQLHPIQQSFWDNHGMQCGYCTPGFVCSTKDLLSENPDPSVTEIQEGLAGHLCRCTGYTKIVESVQDAANRVEGANE